MLMYVFVCVCVSLCSSVHWPPNLLNAIKGLLSSDNSVLPLLLNMLRVEI